MQPPLNFDIKAWHLARRVLPNIVLTPDFALLLHSRSITDISKHFRITNLAMAAALNSIISLVTGSGGESSTDSTPQLDLLAEPQELDPVEYKKLAPLFPRSHKKGDPVPRPVLRRVDFGKYPSSKLSQYADLGAYASVIDNAFTLKECDELLRMAESSSEEGWPIAQVNIGGNEQILDTSYRKGDRILYDNQRLANKLLARIMPLVAKDIAYIDPADAPTGKGPLGWKSTAAKRRADKFRLTRLNERLRFLRYPVSGFFKNNKESSLFTFHLYLDNNTGDVPLKGGATRFWESGAQLVHEMSPAKLKKRGLKPPEFYDVAPIPGRVLVFQHAYLVHSGEPITEGIKLTIRTDFMYEIIPQEDEEIEYRKHLDRNGLLADEIPVDPQDEAPPAADN
ncbi:hypothetical protein Dda_8176 [Drechslerella dactyloides]|uniref:Prolyl 4-hydroxylase alpha subunit domain-containing protein n=1 Tax=Drechslerella dactyloides TaxID=74499 RepID=A0AAD6NGG8_DREDA|nr:hypothetical protein Dda_8176 [Drechslerella dactyloides]